MRICDILNQERIVVDVAGERVVDKKSALLTLGSLLAPSVGVDEAEVFRLLTEREKLQSTGIGDGVAIPHASTDEAPGQVAALLVCARGIPFDAIDGAPVKIVFGVVGPLRATGEHLRTLARISRLLRDTNVRAHLVESANPGAACELVVAQDALL